MAVFRPPVRDFQRPMSGEHTAYLSLMENAGKILQKKKARQESASKTFGEIIKDMEIAEIPEDVLASGTDLDQYAASQGKVRASTYMKQLGGKWKKNQKDFLIGRPDKSKSKIVPVNQSFLDYMSKTYSPEVANLIATSYPEGISESALKTITSGFQRQQKQKATETIQSAKLDLQQKLATLKTDKQRMDMINQDLNTNIKDRDSYAKKVKDLEKRQEKYDLTGEEKLELANYRTSWAKADVRVKALTETKEQLKVQEPSVDKDEDANAIEYLDKNLGDRKPPTGWTQADIEWAKGKIK